MSCSRILENIKDLQTQIYDLIGQGESLSSPRMVILSQKLDELINLCQRLKAY